MASQCWLKIYFWSPTHILFMRPSVLAIIVIILALHMLSSINKINVSILSLDCQGNVQIVQDMPMSKDNRPPACLSELWCDQKQVYISGLKATSL